MAVASVDLDESPTESWQFEARALGGAGNRVKHVVDALPPRYHGASNRRTLGLASRSSMPIVAQQSLMLLAADGGKKPISVHSQLVSCGTADTRPGPTTGRSRALSRVAAARGRFVSRSRQSGRTQQPNSQFCDSLWRSAENRMLNGQTDCTRRSRAVLCGSTIRLQFRGVDGFLGFLRVRHLLRGVADEQRYPTDQEAHPGNQ